MNFLTGLLGPKGNSDSSKTIKMVLGFLSPFITPKNVNSAVTEIRKFIQELQAKTGQKYVVSAELSDDGQALDIQIWRRDTETKRLEHYKAFDLFSLTAEQIKAFLDGARKEL